MKKQQGEDGGQRGHQLSTDGHRCQAFRHADGFIQQVKGHGSDGKGGSEEFQRDWLERFPPGQQDRQRQNGSGKSHLYR